MPASETIRSGIKLQEEVMYKAHLRSSLIMLGEWERDENEKYARVEDNMVEKKDPNM